MLRLQYERIVQRFTQKQLAREAGTFQPYISLVEQGRLQPTPDELERLARVLGVPASCLLTPVAVEIPNAPHAETTR